MVRAYAGHLAPCVGWLCHRLKGSQNREVDIWASDCLNMESPGLLPLGINPLILPCQTCWSSFTWPESGHLFACNEANFDGREQWPNLGSSGLHQQCWRIRRGGPRVCNSGAVVCPTGGLRYTQTGSSSISAIKKHTRGSYAWLPNSSLLLLSYYRWLINCTCLCEFDLKWDQQVFQSETDPPHGSLLWRGISKDS